MTPTDTTLTDTALTHTASTSSTVTATSAHGDERPRHVIDLTDEELLGLDGPTSEQVAPLPWIGPRSDAETELAAEVGLRGLLTHGHVDADGGGLDLPDGLSDVLDLRHDARAIVYADHSTRSAQETRILYVHDEASNDAAGCEATGGDTVLVETVDGAGVHRFAIGDLRGATADLTQWCVPHRHEGEGRIEGDGLPPELAGLQSVVFVDVVTLTGGGDVETSSLTFYRLADGRVAEGDESSGRLELTPLADARVRARVGDTVRRALTA
ncbi:hypothetical protein [Mobilicoccus pelagius]|uniref:Uncharacterized protein n=1 Tax=Mobilicoccus pelagius NBRC 104925 TaxID=1089455 RepID=H5USS3_9MICO|nr:hypothetical protein [Mobilicoccus pelagius]GAB48781.1 hypothetical protein MOPEL_080_00600 [Mobilicoccus pelagius NBRC 104925]